MTFALNQEPWNKGKSWGEETKKKISESKKGKPTWNKGKSWSDDVKKKISEGRKGIAAWNKGKKWPKEVIAKIKTTIAKKKENGNEEIE